MALQVMLLAVLVLNVLDAILTLAVVKPGLAVEANPVMAALLEQGDMVFVLGKITMVSVGAAVLWHYRRRPLSMIGAAVACGCYVLVLLHHLRTISIIAQA